MKNRITVYNDHEPNKTLKLYKCGEVVVNEFCGNKKTKYVKLHAKNFFVFTDEEVYRLQNQLQELRRGK